MIWQVYVFSGKEVEDKTRSLLGNAGKYWRHLVLHLVDLSAPGELANLPQHSVQLKITTTRQFPTIIIFVCWKTGYREFKRGWAAKEIYSMLHHRPQQHSQRSRINSPRDTRAEPMLIKPRMLRIHQVRWCEIHLHKLQQVMGNHSSVHVCELSRLSARTSLMKSG